MAEQGDAVEVGAVGHYIEGVKIVLDGDKAQVVDLLLGVDGGSFGKDVIFRDTVGEEVVATGSTLGVARVFAGAATESDDEWGEPALVKGKRFVKTGVEDG